MANEVGHKTKRGKGTKLMAVAGRAGLPVSVCIASASPHETTLVQQVLDCRLIAEKPKRLIAEKPQRLIGDKAYDTK